MTDETMDPILPAADPVAGAIAVAPARDRRERCAVTKKLRPRKELTLLDSLRPELADFIRREHPNLAEDALISKSAVNAYRSRYVEELLREEHGEFTELDRQVTDEHRQPGHHRGERRGGVRERTDVRRARRRHPSPNLADRGRS